LTAYIIRRLFQALIVIVLASILIFLLVRLLPGDPILLYVSGSDLKNLNPERVEEMRHQFGLDRPMIEQYFVWLGGLFRGDLGDSIFFHRPVSSLIASRLPVTLHLGLVAFFFSSILGIAAGTLSALRRGKRLDFFLTMLANAGITVPIFWLGILLIYIFAFKLGWFPIGGYTSPFKDFWLSTKQIVMPVICLMLFGVAADARQSRSSMLEVIHQDYVRTAWAKGLRERTVVKRHIFKNGIIPIVTFKGMAFAYIIGGCVFTESVFSIPGIGKLAVQAVNSQDYAIIQGIVLLTAVIVTLTNLLVDISYGWLDPRVRYT